MALGGAILTISGLLFFTVLIMTALAAARTEEVVEVPLAEPLHGGAIPWYLDRFRPWVIGAAVLLLLAYGPAVRAAGFGGQSGVARL